MKVVLHSFTDLITNSSTTIYTFSDESEQALVSLIDEICSTFGLKERCVDLFSLNVMPNDNDRFIEWISEHHDEYPEIPSSLYEKGSYRVADNFINNVCAGVIEKPLWFDTMKAEGMKFNAEYGPGTTLHVIPKNPKYEKIAKLVVKFLYSTDSRECPS